MGNVQRDLRQQAKIDALEKEVTRLREENSALETQQLRGRLQESETSVYRIEYRMRLDEAAVEAKKEAADTNRKDPEVELREARDRLLQGVTDEGDLQDCLDALAHHYMDIVLKRYDGDGVKNFKHCDEVTSKTLKHMREYYTLTMAALVESWNTPDNHERVTRDLLRGKLQLMTASRDAYKAKYEHCICVVEDPDTPGINTYLDRKLDDKDRQIEHIKTEAKKRKLELKSTEVKLSKSQSDLQEAEGNCKVLQAQLDKTKLHCKNLQEHLETTESKSRAQKEELKTTLLSLNQTKRHVATLKPLEDKTALMDRGAKLVHRTMVQTANFSNSYWDQVAIDTGNDAAHSTTVCSPQQ